MRPVIIIAKSNESSSSNDKLKFLDAEIDGITEELGLLQRAGKVEVVKLSAASFRSIVQNFQNYRGRVVAFHYSGHANSYQLLLKDKEGLENQSVQSSGLAGFLATQEGLELIFLNGCSTQGQIDVYINAGVKNIIATSQSIRDDLAYELSRAFYRSLTTGASVKQAFAEAKAQVKGQKGVGALRDLVFEGGEAPEVEEDVWRLEGGGQWIPFADQNYLKYCSGLPEVLDEDRCKDRKKWAQSLKQDLMDQGVTVSDRPMDIFNYYGWIIEPCLIKMLSETGVQISLRSLSYMTEAYQSSLRYLCYIQVSQLLQIDHEPCYPINRLQEFLSLSKPQTQISFDYLDLLRISTEALVSITDAPFVPEINAFLAKVNDSNDELYQTSLFLDYNRRRVIKKEINDKDEDFSELLDEYLTALVFWLRHLAFLAKYKMVSVKDISLNYRAGMKKQFVHLYGEHHGWYDHHNIEQTQENNYKRLSLEDVFTYNQSVLLLERNHIKGSFSNCLSLSPLLIDRHVFTDELKQTPEVYYFVSYQKGARKYRFELYRNELPLDEGAKPISNKELVIRSQNNDHPKLNELFKQLEQLCQPIRNSYGQ